MHISKYILRSADYTQDTNIHLSDQFLVTQIEYPLGGSSKRGSHAYFLLIVGMVLLL